MTPEQAFKELSSLVNKLNSGENWNNIRGDAMNFLYDMQRAYIKAEREKEQLNYKLMDLRRAISDLYQESTS